VALAGGAAGAGFDGDWLMAAMMMVMVMVVGEPRDHSATFGSYVNGGKRAGKTS
jgi:hypothetical protein